MSETILLTTATVPSNFCFTTWQASWPYLVSLMSGTLTGNTNTFNFGSTTPTADNQDKPWLRLDPATGAPDRWYVFVAGRWASLVTPYDLNERRIYVGAEDASGVWAYDGGDGSDPGVSAPTLYTGAMWEVDDAMSARFALGAGTLTTSGTVVAVNDTGGADQLTANNLPQHSHLIAIEDGVSADSDTAAPWDGADLGGLFVSTSAALVWEPAGYATANPGSSSITGFGQTRNAGMASPTQSIPPYYGVYFLKRTARMYYTV